MNPETLSGEAVPLGRDCCGQEIIPIPGQKLSAYRNRHTNTDGTGWGWIEGCTLNICWSNNAHFNEKRAYELVHRYNESQLTDGLPEGDAMKQSETPVQCGWCDYEASLAVCCRTEPELIEGHGTPRRIRCRECQSEISGEDLEEMRKQWNGRVAHPEYAI